MEDCGDRYRHKISLCQSSTPKNDDLLLVLNYQNINAQTITNKYLLQLPYDALEQLTGSSLFTTLYLAQRIIQVPLKSSPIEETALVRADGSWKFERLVVGLANGTTEFQRLMSLALGPLRKSVSV